MTHANPDLLATPLPWNLAANGYADILMPWFSQYAVEAIALSEVSPPASIIDVASGPGTLSVLAAERGLRVTAVDFSGRMLEELRRNAKSKGLHTIEEVRANGQSLPFADRSFDAGFSMFGVIFFPSPIQGLSEILRVLRPGGLAAISTWQPLEKTPFLVELTSAVQSEDASFSFPEDELSLPGELEIAMRNTGFINVIIREATYTLESSSLDEMLEFIARSTPPFILWRERISPHDWNGIWASARGRLATRFGEGPQSMSYPAWLGAGQKPTGI